MVRNNPVRKIFELILARVGLARKKSKNFLAGAGLVSPKHTNSRQNVQIPCQNGPIPPHGEKKVKIFLARQRAVVVV